jgi:hypothetical protein
MHLKYSPTEIILSQTSIGGPLDHAISENPFLSAVKVCAKCIQV